MVSQEVRDFAVTLDHKVQVGCKGPKVKRVIRVIGGDQGPKGATGPKGAKGDSGSTSLPTVNANLNMRGFKLEQLGNPTQSNDSAHKLYVDSEVSKRLSQTQGDARYLKLDPQDALAASLSMGNNRITTLADPTDQLDAANKKYVDSRLGQSGITQHTADNRYLSLNGGGLRGNLNMYDNRITNLGSPTDNNDAATKGWLENRPSSGISQVAGDENTA